MKRHLDVPVRVRTVVDSVETLVGGLGSAVLALLALLLVAVTAAGCLVGVGLLFAPAVLRAVRSVADRERERLGRKGPAIIGPPPLPDHVREAVADRSVRRELLWVAVFPAPGLLLGVLGLALPVNAVRDGTFLLWWWSIPPDYATSSLGWPVVHSWAGAAAVSLLGVTWAVVMISLGPGLARLQAWPGRRLLAPDRDADLSLRVQQLTTTRAAALDAHGTELRRIERSLHDGAQNRLVAVAVLVGAARRALDRDPASAAPLLDRAQTAAEQALAELRTVARSILPPVLTDRGLAGALSALAAGCPVPCRIEVDLPGRCAASVEATAYFVVSEALTNVARHSGARHVSVTARRQGARLVVQVRDDGHGGADENAGSGLSGIRRRAEAHDGSLSVTSPPAGPTTIEVDLPCGS